MVSIYCFELGKVENDLVDFKYIFKIMKKQIIRILLIQQKDLGGYKNSWLKSFHLSNLERTYRMWMQ